MVNRADQLLIGRVALAKQIQATLRFPGGPGCILAGSTGVGKSHLARHCVNAVEHPDRPVMRLLATRSAGSIPLGVFAPFIGDCGEQPVALGQAYTTILERAGSKGLVLLVDDAHLLDEASAALLLMLASSPSVTCLVTYRTGEPCPDAVIALWKDLGIERLEVGPFSRAETTEFIRVSLDVDLPSPTLEHLGRLSGNRPLTLRELLRPAADGGVMVATDGVWTIPSEITVPPTLRDLLRAHLDGLGPLATDLVASLALCEPLPVKVCEGLVGADVMHAAATSGLVRFTHRTEDVHGGWIFDAHPGHRVTEVRLDHPLIGDVALAGLSQTVIARLLSDAASMMLLESDDDCDRLRSTHWRLQAGASLDPTELVTAARHHFRAGNYGRCVDLGRTAWELENTFEAGLLLGFSLGRSGCFTEADELLAEVVDLAADPGELTMATITRAEIIQQGLGDARRAVALCLDAEARIADPTRRAELAAYRAIAVVQAGRFTEVIDMLELFLDPTTVGERAFVTAAYPAGVALARAGRSEDATTLALTALPLHEALWDREWFQTEPGVHHVTTFTALIGSGHFDEAEGLLEAARDATRNAEPPYAHAWMCLLSGQVALHQGRCMDAIGHCRLAVDIFTRSKVAGPIAWGQAALAAAYALHGDFDAARTSLDHFDHLPESGFATSIADEARGRVQAGTGDLVAARDTLTAAAENARLRGDKVGMIRLALALSEYGCHDTALDVAADAAADYQGDLAMLTLAVLEALSGSGDPVDLENLAEECRSRGLHLLATEVWISTASAYRRAGNGRRAARAISRAGTASLLTQGARTPITEGLLASPTLTAREREVAGLAAAGVPSKTISSRLGINVRTVDNHLGNVYRKLGIGGRRELEDALDLLRPGEPRLRPSESE